MSKTVSFRCSDELDEFLEQEAERRMTTKSTVAQMIVAEYARDVSNDPATENDAVTPPEAGNDASDRANDVFDRHPDVWYRPDSKENDFAVYVPEDAGNRDAGGTRYYKTEKGAAEALQRWYE